jgi:hypothetical protein
MTMDVLLIEPSHWRGARLEANLTEYDLDGVNRMIVAVMTL